jgi:hypothetical protein
MLEISGIFLTEDGKSLITFPGIGKTPIPSAGKDFRPLELIKTQRVSEKKILILIRGLFFDGNGILQRSTTIPAAFVTSHCVKQLVISSS